MADIEAIQNPTSSSSSTKKHVRQPPSVPFLWEVRPGTPIKDWKPEARLVDLVPEIPPVKLIVSVPFQWEEKPGIPLSSFSEASRNSSTKEYTYKFVEVDESLDEYWAEEAEENTSDLDFQEFGSRTEYSHTSIPSLLANCFVSSRAISMAVPEHGIPLPEVDDEFGKPESLSSPSSGEESFATGNSSLAGSSFLECMFPLFPPNSGLLWKDGNAEETRNLPDSSDRKVDQENSVTVRRPSTLGELILMSRRRSCRRKADQMRRQDFSTELMTRGAIGCCAFVSRSKIRDIKKKQLPWLKPLW